MQTLEFVRALPKAELHLRLEGAIPWAMVRSHSLEPLPERPPWWADDFRFDDFDHFRLAAQTCLACLTDLGTYEAAAASIFRDLRSQNVRYVEISFDVERIARQELPFAHVVATIKRAAPPALRVSVFGGFSYHKADRTPTGLINAVLTTPGLDGIDLHGDERRAEHRPLLRGLPRGAPPRAGDEGSRGRAGRPQTRSRTRSTCSASGGSSTASGRSRTKRCSRAWPRRR